ncbi:MAG: AAA family ATPase [Bacteroidota bacterium]
MKVNLEQLLNDCGIEFKKVETVYKSRKCIKYELKHCLFDKSHIKNDACILQYEKGKIVYKCFHNSCLGFTWENARKELKEKYNLNLAKYWPDSNIKLHDNSNRKEITYLSGADVISKPVEIEWIITDMLAMHESILIHASGGLGKSMFVLYLILSLASFKNTIGSFLNGFLGDKFTIPKKRCSLILSAENGRVATYQRLKKMCNGSDDLESGLKNIFFLSQYDDTTITGEVFLDESFCDFLVEFIKQIEQKQNIKIDLFVIDPLISFSGVKNENDSADMRPALDAIDRVCKQIKCTPIVVHHDKKDGDNYRGASAVNDWTRNRISLKREFIAEDRITDIDVQGNPTRHRVVKVPVLRIFHEKCNNFQIFESFLVRMTNYLHFEQINEQLSPDDAEKARTVTQALIDMGSYAESTNALAKVYQELAGVSKNTAKKCITIAVNNGLIRRESTKTKGKPTYEYYPVFE